MSDNIITITDFMDPNLDVYARLTENQLLNRANPVSYTHLDVYKRQDFWWGI